MKDGVGEGYTRADHPALSNQLYAAYARVGDIRSLSAVVGEEELSATDRRYLAFGEAFEREFMTQRLDENRSLDQTLDLGWRALSLLPREELTRVSESLLAEHYHPPTAGDGDAAAPEA